MRNLVLVALVLQLVFTSQIQFGDIISFKRSCTNLGALYKHFAVYVGDVDFPGKRPGQDIFHRTGTKEATGDCGFGVLIEEKGVAVEDNFLDEYFPGEMGTADHRDQMIERIKYWNKLENCGIYNVLKNNCEHLATHVRYGYRLSLQRGTTAGRLCKIGLKTLDCGEIYKMVKDLEENEINRENCIVPTNPVNPLMICAALSVFALLVCAFLLVCYLVFRKRSRGHQ